MKLSPERLLQAVSALLLAGLAAAQTPPVSAPAAQRIATARALLRAMKLDSAALLLRQVVDSSAAAAPAERVEAWVLIGVAEFYRGADSDAVRAFREAFGLDPNARAQLPDSQLQRWFDGLRPAAPATVGAAGPTGPPKDAVYDCVRKCPPGVQPPKVLPGSGGLVRVRVDPAELPPGPMTVELRAVVDTLGFVEPGSIEVLPSGAPAALSDPVIEELRNRRYTPAKLEGRPVRVRIEVRIKIPSRGRIGP